MWVSRNNGLTLSMTAGKKRPVSKTTGYLLGGALMIVGILGGDDW